MSAMGREPLGSCQFWVEGRDCLLVRRMPYIWSRVTGLAIAFAVCGCARPGAMLPGSSAILDPIDFFTGRTHGEGKLKKLFSSPVKVTVDSVGRRHGNSLTLDQTIREGEKPPRVRRWTMRLVAPNVYSGFLTDAAGPVEVIVSGPRAFIRYTMRDGLKVKQQLTLQSDGRTVLNRLDVSKFGARVATLKETIRKLDSRSDARQPTAL
jgi:hypothetical protein